MKRTLIGLGIIGSIILSTAICGAVMYVVQDRMPKTGNSTAADSSPVAIPLFVGYDNVPVTALDHREYIPRVEALREVI